MLVKKNKKYLLILLFIMLFGYELKAFSKSETKAISTNENRQVERQRFISAIGEVAQKKAAENDLFASVMIAQAALESNFGTSVLGSEPNNNLFGIKWNKGDLWDKVFVWTKEANEKGELVDVYASFRKYPDIKYSLQDNVDKLKKGVSWDKNRYKGAWKSVAKKYSNATKHLQGRYATDPNYAQKLNKLIEQYQLNRFDKQFTYFEIDEDVRLIEGGYSVYSAPKGFEGAKYLGKTKQYVGKDFTIKKESIAPDGVSYEIPGIGWVGKNAFEQLSKPKYKTVDQDVRLLNGSFAVYNVPKYYKGYKYLSNAKAYEGQDFTITREATSKDGVSYEIPGVGWVGKNAFEQLSKPKYKTVDQDVRLLNGSFAVYNVPKYYKGYKYLSNAKAYEGQDFTITREATSKDGVSYELKETDDKVIGWVGKNAFENLEPENYKTINKKMWLDSSKGYAIYSKPKYYKGYQKTGNIKTLASKDYLVTRQATASDGISYEISLNDEVIGWVGKGAFKEIEHPSYESVNKEMRLTGSNFGVSTAPKYYENYSYLGTVSSLGLAGKDCLVTRQAQASDGISYEISVEGQVIGWAGKNAFENLEPENYKTINKKMWLDSSKGYAIYSKPKYYKGYQKTGNIKTLASKDYLVTRQATASDGISYEISLNDEVIGWVGKGAFKEIEHPSYESVNKEMRLTGSNFGVSTAPKYYENYSYLGTVSSLGLAGKDCLVTRQAQASDGISYEISVEGQVIGWVGKNAFAILQKTQAITETESEELIETESEELIETESELSEESQEEKKYPLSDESTTVEMIDESLELLYDNIEN
ncbi:hypothetical protein G7081_07455 [Vagococcus coleopterorum]|uniref:GW domain-containing protein n=1 Tax=Vagococcus coleopterorum TaxID=2714946 RepID=A0A6G8APQ2_9ENTE|nr:GW dipeptide domain-containing protein [Vagococcus coleopterorum]QIL46922.1 hypothetical protein G7081_07455 [Vagococcus coleopterorum]